MTNERLSPTRAWTRLEVGNRHWESRAHLPGHLDAIVQRLRPAFHKATGTTLATEADVAQAGEAGTAALIDKVIPAG